MTPSSPRTYPRRSSHSSSRAISAHGAARRDPLLRRDKSAQCCGHSDIPDARARDVARSGHGGLRRRDWMARGVPVVPAHHALARLKVGPGARHCARRRPRRTGFLRQLRGCGRLSRGYWGHLRCCGHTVVAVKRTNSLQGSDQQVLIFTEASLKCAILRIHYLCYSSFLYLTYHGTRVISQSVSTFCDHRVFNTKPRCNIFTAYTPFLDL